MPEDVRLSQEEFKSVKGFEDRYAASSHGRIKNIRTGRILKTRILDNGLERVNLFDGKRQQTFYVHRLVLSNFEGTEDFNVIHLDENKLNNRLSNLAYDYDAPFFKPGTGVSHKTVINVKTGEEYESIREASEKVNINYANLSSMLSGKVKNKTNLCLKN